MGLTRCPKCDGPLSTTAASCPRCSRGPGGGETFTCYECQAKVPDTLEFCPECGCPLNPKEKPAPPVPATKPCPGCDRPVDPNLPTCPSCGEEVRGRVVSFCPACRDEYIVAEADKTFTCPRCRKVCDIAEGMRILRDLVGRRAKKRRPPGFRSR